MRELFGEFSPKSSPPRRGLLLGTRLNPRRPLGQSRRSICERRGNSVSLSYVPRPLERERDYREKESLLPRPVYLDALSLHWLMVAAPFGSRGAALDISPAQRAGCWW